MKQWINEIEENILGIKCIISQLILFGVFCAGLLVIGLGIQVVRAEIMPQTALKNIETGALLYIPFTQMSVSQDIYTVNADGTGLTALTNTPENECYPTWSPDGSEIAFARRKGGHFVISVMNANGANVRDLMEPDLTRSIDHIECTPAWSPDGNEIAFTSSRDGNLEIYIMNTDGSNPRNLTNNPAGDAFPAWSPDGNEVAFTSDRDGNIQVYICDRDGQDIRQITNGEISNFAPSWSPDGKQILVTARNPEKVVQLDVIDIVEKSKMKSSLGTTNALFAAWSGNGHKIAYSTVKQMPPAINVLDTTTQTSIPITVEQKEKNEKVVLGRTAKYCRPQWSPDNTKLVFSFTTTKEIQPGPPGPDFEWPMRWLYLGKHGELFVPGRHITHSGINELRIEPLDGGFALVHTGPKWSGTYAFVRPDCKIQILAPAPKEMDKSSASQFWPYCDEEGLPAMPPYGAVIAAKNAVSHPNLQPPEGMISWVFLCADGDFYTPEKGVLVHANTFWVKKEGDGFQFVRTGPIKKGEIYATVTPTCNVIFAPDTYEGPALCWRHLNPQEKPIFPSVSGKWFPPSCDDSAPIITEYPDGSIGAWSPPIP